MVPAATTFFQNGVNGYLATQDTQLSLATPTTAVGSATTIGVNGSAAATTQSLLRFDNLFGSSSPVTQVPSNAFIRNAFITFTTTATTGDGGSFHRMKNSWDESTATWDLMTGGIVVGDDTEAEREGNAGNTSGNNDPTVSVARVVNVTDSVRAWQGGATNNGWAIVGITTNANTWNFTSSEGTAASRPSLTIEWDVADGSPQQVRFQDGINGYTDTVDTYLQENVPTADNSINPSFFVDFADAANTNQVLIRFGSIIGAGVGQIPANSTIVAASLQLSGTGTNSQGDGGQFHRMVTPFIETDNWSTFGGNGVQNDGAEAAILANTVAGNAARTADPQSNRNVFDVTADLQAWVNGTANHGWAILPWTSGTDGWGINSSETANVGDRPGLIVSYIVPPTITPTAIPRQVVNEDAAPSVVNLASFFSSANPITYTVEQTNSAGLVAPSIVGSDLTLTFGADKFGYSYFRVTANDGVTTRTTAFEVLVNPRSDLVDDSVSVSSASSTAINVLGNDGVLDLTRLAEAGNLAVLQINNADTTASVNVTLAQGSSDLSVPVPATSTRGDYAVQIGVSAADDVAGGLLLSTPRENGRDNSEPTATDYGTSTTTADATGWIANTSPSPVGGEYNANLAVAYFPWTQGWLGALNRNAAGTNGGANNQFTTVSSTGAINLTSVVQHLGGGLSTVAIPGINSQTDGVLIVIHGKDEDNYTLARANVDGSWSLFTRDNQSDLSLAGEQDPIAFVYVPRHLANVASGRILGDGSVQLAGGNFSVTKTGTGTYELAIPGQTPLTGVLMLSPEGGNGENQDNIVSYQASGSNFVIQTRDILVGGTTGGDPVLEDVGAAVPVASFVFVPFLNTPAHRVTNVPALSTLGATLSINADGTVNYDPSTSVTIQALAPETSTADSFTYTTTNINGLTTTATVNLTVTAPTLWYVDDAWVGLNPNDPITDANPTLVGDQPAVFGTNAFASLNSAMAASPPLNQKVVINAGTYAEDAIISKAVEITFQQGDSTFTSLSDSITGATIKIQPSVTLIAGSAADKTLATPMSGAGGFKKLGSGTLTFGAANTYSGATAIDAGNLSAGIANAYSPNSAVTLGAGTELRLNGLSQTIGTPSGTGTITNDSAIPATITISTTANSTFAGNLAQGAGALAIIKDGSGQLTLSGVNTSTGLLTVNAGTLLAGSATALGLNNDLIVSGGTLTLNGFNASFATLTGTGAIVNGAASAATLTVGSSADSTFTGSMSNGGAGTLGFVKTGTGTFNANSANSYTGGTTLSQGTLAAKNNTAYGSGPITLGDASTGSNNIAFLATANGLTFANNFIVSANGSGTATIGSNDGITGAVNTQWNGTVTLHRDVILRAGSADRTTFAGKISGTGNITVTAPLAANRVALAQAATSANDFVGDINVSSGNLQVGVSSVTANQFIPDATSITVASGAKLTFSSTGTAAIEGFNALNGAGVVNQIGGTNYQVVVGLANASGDYSGTIGAVLGGFTMIKDGTGTQILSGANTAAIATAVNGGTLFLNNSTGSALGTGAVTVGTLGTLGGTGAITGASTVNGRLAPGTLATSAILGTGSLSFGTGSILAVNLNNTTAGTGHDQLNVTGSPSISNATLEIHAPGVLALNDKFMILANDSTDGVIGGFVNGSLIRAVDNPRYTFSVNTAAGTDNNDIELTLITIDSPRTLNVVANQVIYSTTSGEANGLTITHDGTDFTITDSAGAITLTTAAQTAGWSIAGGGGVTGPITTTANGLVLNLGDGTDSLTTVNAAAANLSLIGSGTLTVSGASTTTGTMKVSGFTNLVLNQNLAASALTAQLFGSLTASASGKLSVGTATLAVAQGIGTSANRLSTDAGSIAATSTGSVFITEANGVSLTAALTGIGELNIQNTVGTLTIGGATSTFAGPVILSSGDGVAVNANLSSTAGTISVAANKNADGSEGYTQANAATVSTTNFGTSAFQLTVNSPGGGTGDAVLGLATIGSIAAGRATVTVFNGSILWGQTQPGLEDSGDNLLTFDAGEYVFTTTGVGGIGSAAAPFQVGNVTDPAAALLASSLTLSAGSGGIYWIDWDTPAVTVTSAAATGGDIRLVAGNAGSHNLNVNGNVTLSGSGSIYIAANDNVVIGPNVLIGNTTGYTGPVTLSANRDRGNSGNLTMNATTSVITGNTGPNAVLVNAFTDADVFTTLILGNITTGNGGTITLDGLPESLTAEIGRVFMASAANILDAGPTGTIAFRGGNVLTTVVDNFGTTALPIRVTGGTIVVQATKNANATIVSTGAASFSASNLVSGSVGGALNFTTTSGVLTVGGAIGTDGGAINLTGAGGVSIAAALGDADSGAVSVTGAATVAGGFNYTPVANTTFNNSVTVASGATFNPRSDTVHAGVVTANSGATLVPAGAATGIVTLNGLDVSQGKLNVQLNTTTAGTGHDQIALATGALNLTNAILTLTTAPTLAVNDSFTLIANATGTAAVGQFAAGTLIYSSNNPSQEFTVNYAGGGSGKDVVITLSQILTGNILSVSSGQLTYGGAAGLDNALAVSLSSGNYTFTDTAPITLTGLAVAAGWSGSGTTTVTGPSASVTSHLISTADGTDTVTLNSLDDPFTVNGGGDAGDAAIIGGTLTFSGNATITAVGSITRTGIAKLITPTGTVTLSASAIGTSTDPILTQAAGINATVSAGDLYLTEDDGAAITATSTGVGNLNVINTTGTLSFTGTAAGAGNITATNMAGLLSIAGATASTTGNITLSSGDGVETLANVNAGSGTIAIAANTDGLGSQSFDQKGATLTTTNTSTTALAITVNTMLGGTGDAIIGKASIGSNTGGTATLSSFAGNILWSNDPSYPTLTASQIGLINGGSNLNTFRAFTTDFKTGSSGGAGTTSRPIQLDNYGINTAPSAQANVTASVGAGGIYVTGWDSSGALDLTVGAVSATGAGGIRIVAAAAGGHNIWIAGNVSAETGNIFLACDDDFSVGGGVTIGGAGMLGTIWLESNRDAGTAGQPLSMAIDAAVITANTANVVTATRDQTTQAVMLRANGDQGTPSPITLGNISTGNGGRIVVNAIPNGIAAEAGRILMASLVNTLNPGAAGVVDLTAGISATTAGEAIGDTLFPINVSAGTVVANSNYGNIWINSGGSINFSAAMTASIAGQTAPASISVNATDNITLNGNVATVGGGGVLLTVGAAKDIVLAGGATLGSALTGGISINGKFSGTGNVTLGSGDLMLTQNDNSSFGGIVTGSQNLVKAGSGAITFSAVQNYTGTTTVNEGSLLVNGSTAASSGTTVAPGATLGGTGTVSTASVAGRITGGTDGGAGKLSTGNIAITGTFVADLLGVDVGTGHDQLAVTGTVDISNSLLSITAPNAIPAGTKLTILSNNDTDTVVGKFSNLPGEGDTITVNSQDFTISYVGGTDNNDVVLTRAGVVAPEVTGYFANGSQVQRSRLTTITVTFQNDVNAADFQSLGNVSLQRTGIPSNNVGTIGTLVRTGGSGATEGVITVAQGASNSLVLTFSNPGGVPSVANIVEYGSLGDGRWRLSIPSASYQSALDDLQLRRLFGDIDNNGTVDGNTDFAQFGNTFGVSSSQPGFVAAFDFDNNGAIDGTTDFAQFGGRFGVTA